MGQRQSTVRAIGIDLGTTHSCVGLYENQTVRILENNLGAQTTPSCIAFTDTEVIVGHPARNSLRARPENQLHDIKRLIGRRFDDPTVQADIPNLPYRVVEQNGLAVVELSIEFMGKRRRFYPQELSAIILECLRRQVDDYIDMNGGKTAAAMMSAVITVPAYFNDAQRYATRDAGRLAGLNVERVLNESTAAAISLGVDRCPTLPKRANVLIYDLGGGTFDVSVLEIERRSGIWHWLFGDRTRGCNVEVRAVGGDSHLGGEDFTRLLMDHMVRMVTTKHDMKPINDARAMRMLRIECERAKLDLSSHPEVIINLPNLQYGIDVAETITVAEFEHLCAHLFERTMTIMMRTLEDAHLRPDDIHEVIMVGGSARIPILERRVRELFGDTKTILADDHDVAIARGATLLAAQLANRHLNESPITLADVMPLTIGLQVGDGDLVPIIARNSSIPCTRRHIIDTGRIHMCMVRCRIYEGEPDLRPDEIHWLAEFTLSNLRLTDGETGYELTFDIDTDGVLEIAVLNLSDRDRHESDRIGIQLDRTNRPSMAEIDRMLSGVGGGVGGARTTT